MLNSWCPVQDLITGRFDRIIMNFKKSQCQSVVSNYLSCTVDRYGFMYAVANVGKKTCADLLEKHASWTVSIRIPFGRIKTTFEGEMMLDCQKNRAGFETCKASRTNLAFL